jgi:phosphatidylglycerophosphatase A
MTGPRLPRAIATLGYVGLMRPASGTWGSAVAVALAWALHVLGGPLLLALAAALLYALGHRAVQVVTKGLADPDRSEIVVDEAVGQWIALLPVSAGAVMAGAPVLALWPGILFAFLAFRFFDIVKVWPANRLDARKDATGVMADDVVAGIYAALAVAVAAAIAHGALLA